MNKLSILGILSTGILLGICVKKYIDYKIIKLFAEQDAKVLKQLYDHASKTRCLRQVQYATHGDEYLLVNVTSMIKNANPVTYTGHNPPF